MTIIVQYPPFADIFFVGNQIMCTLYTINGKK